MILDKSIDHKVLHDTFCAFGVMTACKVAQDADGDGKGYGFVHFVTDEAVQLAIRRCAHLSHHIWPFCRKIDFERS